ncbi:MAG TPA: hypothetical protein PKC69_05535 [Chitinophagaceae bacterium]|nr:hypothetical protein [Chitinophagaceae bacterium]
MKHTRLLAIAAALLFTAATACNSEKEDKEKDAAAGAQSPADGEKKKTEVTVGPDGAGIKTKSGDEVKVNKDGSSVETKDLKIRVNTKDTGKKN